VKDKGKGKVENLGRSKSEGDSNMSESSAALAKVTFFLRLIIDIILTYSSAVLSETETRADDGAQPQARDETWMEHGPDDEIVDEEDEGEKDVDGDEGEDDGEEEEEDEVYEDEDEDDEDDMNSDKDDMNGDEGVNLLCLFIVFPVVSSVATATCIVVYVLETRVYSSLYCHVFKSFEKK